MNPHSQENLLTYLNDHWAGSIGAVALIDDLTSKEVLPELTAQLTALRTEIENDQMILKEVIEKLGGEVDEVKSVTAWFAEKMARIKLSMSHDREGVLGAFEALEILALGIEGKRLLWVALDECQLEGLLPSHSDLTELISSAQDQGQRVQHWRLISGRAAFLQP